MKNIMFILVSIYHLNCFSQDDFDCDGVMYQYEELARLHKESFIKFCEQVEYKVTIENTTLEQTTRNKQQFLASYLNFFMNNPETKTTLRSLAKSEQKGRECLDNEIFKYDVKNNFIDLKNEIKLQVNEKYIPAIDYMFKIIIKKLKLDNTI